MSDPTVILPPRAETVDNGSRIIGQRGRDASLFLIVLLGSAAGFNPNTVPTPAKVQTFIESPVDATPWRPSPLLPVLSAYPNDVTQGWDNFQQWPPEPAPFIQARGPALIVSLTSYVAYNPAKDVLGRGNRKPWFDPSAEFTAPQKPYLLTALAIKPAPVGDLTTQLRKPQGTWESLVWDQKAPGAWHIALMPQVAPLPPPPVTPLPTPWPLPSAVTNLPCRGAWEIPGGTQSIWVIGSGCFLMSVASPATAFTPTTFSLKRVGTLSTSTGPVGIRDNGAGGTVVIVDGPNGYFYTVATQKFAKITDPDFLGATHVAFIDGWWVFNQPKTQIFYTPTSTYSTVFNASNFALKDGSTDLLVALIESKEELWLIGEKTTEIWYDAGGQFFAFQRLVSTLMQVGCSAPYSVARFSSGGQDGLAWLSRSDRGQNVVIKTRGFEAEVISTPAVSDAIATYQLVSDAIGYTYQEDGHEFYVLTFPSADVTWVYDGMTNLWHQRLSYDPYSNTYHRHRSNCFLNFQNQRLVGDYQNGSIYRMDRTIYTDSGWPLVAWRRTPHIWDGGARERVYMASLQVEFAAGVGNSAAPDPQAILQISRDGGNSWSQQFKRSIGKIGAFLNRCIWRKLSISRDAVIDVKVIDPVNRDVVGATLKRMSE